MILSTALWCCYLRTAVSRAVVSSRYDIIYIITIRCQGPRWYNMPIQHNPSHLYQLWFIPSPKYFHTVDVFPSLSPSFFWLLVISCLILARTFSKGAAHERKHWHRRIWRYRRHKPVLSLCADTIGPLITGLMHPPPGLYAQVVFVLLKCWGHCQCVCVSQHLSDEYLIQFYCVRADLNRVAVLCCRTVKRTKSSVLFL